VPLYLPWTGRAAGHDDHLALCPEPSSWIWPLSNIKETSTPTVDPVRFPAFRHRVRALDTSPLQSTYIQQSIRMALHKHYRDGQSDCRLCIPNWPWLDLQGLLSIPAHDGCWGASMCACSLIHYVLDGAHTWALCRNVGVVVACHVSYS
jgi:hypothetical protein